MRVPCGENKAVKGRREYVFRVEGRMEGAILNRMLQEGLS